MCMTSFHPPFSEGSKILNSVRASNLAWLPPTVYSNCSERLWLHARAVLVAMENYSGWPGESNSELAWRRSPTHISSTYASSFAYASAKTRIQSCLRNCRWNLAMSYRWKLTILTKIATLQKQSSCSQACGFATITVYSWWQPGEIRCAYRI